MENKRSPYYDGEDYERYSYEEYKNVFADLYKEESEFENQKRGLPHVQALKRFLNPFLEIKEKGR
jgi:hypothetical protein